MSHTNRNIVRIGLLAIALLFAGVSARALTAEEAAKLKGQCSEANLAMTPACRAADQYYSERVNTLLLASMTKQIGAEEGLTEIRSIANDSQQWKLTRAQAQGAAEALEQWMRQGGKSPVENTRGLVGNPGS